MSQTIEQKVIKAGTGTSKIGQIRRAWYDNGILEEVICIAPGQTIAGPEVWPLAIGNYGPPPEPEPPPVGELVKAIDISNYQPAGQQLIDIIGQYQAEHVIVRIPQRVEGQSLHVRARAQIKTVLDVGATLGGYGWLYKDVPQDQQAHDWVDFLISEGVRVPWLWIDEEPYQSNDNLASIEQIKVCANTLRDRGEHPGVYTGPWVWALLDGVVDPEINAMPLWTAEYTEIPTLEGVTLYGGWTACVGHQYSASGGIDQNVFDKRYTVL